MKAYRQQNAQTDIEGDSWREDLVYESSDPDSNCSTRTPSSTHGLLSPDEPTPRGRIRRSPYRKPRRFTRYFTIIIVTVLVLFIFMLTQMSRLSSRRVQLGLFRSPPKPPPWDKFPFLERYYGGIRTLNSRESNRPEYPGELGDKLPSTEGDEPSASDNATLSQKNGSVPSELKFHPYPDYASEEYQSKYGHVVECFLDEAHKTRIPSLRAYSGIPESFPNNVMGSYDLLGLRDDVCFDRFGKLGPYGLGYSRRLGGSGAGMEGDREGIEIVWADAPEVDFSHVDWADAQRRCGEVNKHRFKPKEKSRDHAFQAMSEGMPDQHLEARDSAIVADVTGEVNGNHGDPTYTNSSVMSVENTSAPKQLLPRTAILLRTWSDYKYQDEELFLIRALISELSLKSGGEFTVHILVHVKDDNKQIWSDEATYHQVLNDSLPEEFRGLGTLWSERQMGLIYGGLQESFYRNMPVHGVYRSTFMPVQYFAHRHPEYDYFWQWEMDIRYTGHLYHFIDRVSRWAASQPRKGLWERNARFYIPKEHGSWDDFRQMVRVQTEHGTNSKSNAWSKMSSSDRYVPDSVKHQQRPEKSIWGPEPPIDDELETENDPKPLTSYKEDNYEWGVGEEADLITFNPIFNPDGTGWILADDVTGYNTSRQMPPRRVSIITASRLSRRLLETMHRETALKRHTMFSEMWPASCALHHGYKAVYVPHPVFIDRRWPTDYLAAVMNGGLNGASGGSRMSVFSDDRQHNFRGTTWYYNSGFAPNLWKRWLGYRVDGNGGEEAEVNGEGRMCLPAMLLHPVKHVDLIYERADES